MPRKGYKSVTVPTDQWRAIQKIVKSFPQVAGRSVAEFYIIAASDRLKEMYGLVQLSPESILSRPLKGKT